MGTFSRDPKTRLIDARSKHYVSVRLQQGVPIVDADFNELEDLRRSEFEDGGKWVLGNGVPTRNNGFRIVGISAGNVNTINLVSKTFGTSLSKLKIDLLASTAAAALGFNATNSSSQRFGNSPAQLTGNRAQPFPLANGNTLVIKTDNNPPETITFLAGAFANIAAATAAEGPPEQVGQWGPVMSWPLVAVHMSLLSSGNVLFTLIGFAGMYLIIGLLYILLIVREVDHGPRPEAGEMTEGQTA